MFKYLVMFLSLFSVGSARMIGSDPNTWSPNTSDINKCDSCKFFVTNVANFIDVHEQDIVSKICTDAKCDLIVEGEIQLIEDFFKDPQVFCEYTKMCKKTHWWQFRDM